jgi:hypothetical protein
MEKYLDSFLPFRMEGKSQTQGPKKNHNLWGGAFGLSKLKLSCHYAELSQIQEMKSIPQPRMPTEIYTF